MSNKRIIAGIDLGSSKVVTVVASLGEEEKIKIIGVASIPSLGVRKGLIVNIEETSQSVVNSVEAAERMAGYNINDVFISVGGSHLASQNSTGVVAVAEPEGEIIQGDIDRVIEAAQAVSLPSSREIIHVVPRFFTVDGQAGVKDPISMSGVRLEVETHIISGATTAIRNLKKCVTEAGVNILGIVANGLAASSSVLTETEKELGVILVDIGGGTTNVAIYVEGAPFYTAVLPVGAKNVTNDLAIGLRLSLEAAEKIKICLSTPEKTPTLPASNDFELAKEEKSDQIELAKLGIPGETKSVSRKTLTEGIIKPRLNEIFTMVGLEIKKSGAAGLTPAGVVICGGGAQTAGVAKSAKTILAMPVRIGQPQGLGGLIDDFQSPEFAVAAGLIIFGSKTKQTGGSFSFLHKFSKTFQKLPVKGVVGKVVDLIRSFLP